MIKTSKRVKKIEISNSWRRREFQNSLPPSGRYQIKTSEFGGGRHSVSSTESQPIISRQESRDREITFVMVATKE
jgi:hypothetical protein